MSCSISATVICITHPSEWRALQTITEKSYGNRSDAQNKLSLRLFSLSLSETRHSNACNHSFAPFLCFLSHIWNLYKKKTSAFESYIFHSAVFRWWCCVVCWLTHAIMRLPQYLFCIQHISHSFSRCCWCFLFHFLIVAMRSKNQPILICSGPAFLLAAPFSHLSQVSI